MDLFSIFFVSMQMTVSWWDGLVFHLSVATGGSHLMLMFCEITWFAYGTPWCSCECHTTTAQQLPGLLYLSISLTSISYILYKGRGGYLYVKVVMEMSICFLYSLHLNNIFHEMCMTNRFSVATLDCWGWGQEASTRNSMRYCIMYM